VLKNIILVFKLPT